MQHVDKAAHEKYKAQAWWGKIKKVDSGLLVDIQVFTDLDRSPKGLRSAIDICSAYMDVANNDDGRTKAVVYGIKKGKTNIDGSAGDPQRRNLPQMEATASPAGPILAMSLGI